MSILHIDIGQLLIVAGVEMSEIALDTNDWGVLLIFCCNLL